MKKGSRHCAVPGCRGWAVRGGVLCRVHVARQRRSARDDEQDQGGAVPSARDGTATTGPQGEPLSEGGASPAAAGLPAGLYAHAFSAEELAEITRQLGSPQRSMEMEVALMRVLIGRVLERIGEEDPLKALPLVRQGVDAICRALRAERVLAGDSADSLAGAFAVALREIGEELGINEE